MGYGAAVVKRLGEAAIRRALHLLQDPRVMKVMADPRVMNFVMQAMGARGRATAAWQKRSAKWAHKLGLATKAQLRELEHSVRQLQAKVDKLKAQDQG